MPLAMNDIEKQATRSGDRLPITPQSHVPTRQRKRRRSLSPDSDLRPEKVRVLDELPPSALLLGLPKLLAVPPNHKSTVASYLLSISAMRKCAEMESLPPDLECRAWTALAELGLKIVRAGWSHSDQFPWAQDLELEVESAIGKGLLIAQRSPSLIVYKQALTLLHSRLAHFQNNLKQSRTLLKRLSSTFATLSTARTFEVARTPSWLIYSTHLTIVSHALSTVPPDLSSTLSALQDLLSVSERLGDVHVKLLSHVLQLRTFVDAGMWDSVQGALTVAESALGLAYDGAEVTTSTGKGKGKTKETEKSEEFVSFQDTFEAAMAIHVLIMAVVYFTHAGSSKDSSPRLSHLHALLDSDALSTFPNGVIDIKLSSGPPLTIKCTHPRTLYHLAYLVSSVSKRDAAGRRPKRKVFATEGLNVWAKEVKKEIPLLPWADSHDAEEVDERMVKIKADLLSELVAVCIMRSEFDDAAIHLATFIAHCRIFGLFSTYAARITLHHAHLAHALGDAARAGQCYDVATALAEDGTFVNVASRAGRLSLSIAEGGDGRDLAEDVGTLAQACSGMGGTLEAIGHVLQACVSPEILYAKEHLKAALNIARRAQDNHLLALIFALIAAVYMRTAEDHARSMLEAAGQLAAGLGAPVKKTDSDSAMGKSATATSKEDAAGETSLGNAPLGLWVGQQFLEMYKRAGSHSKARKQEIMNAKLSTAVQRLSERRQILLSES